MISSVCSNFREVVKLTVTDGRFTGERLQTEVEEVIEDMEDIGFKVIALGSDNASQNAACFSRMLQPGKTFTVSPDRPGSKSFLIYDPTHNFKNIYNKFLARRFFTFPPLPVDEVPELRREGWGEEPVEEASINAVEALYTLEKGESIQSTKLSATAFDNASIQRSSAKWAFQIFHPTTSAALRLYASRPEGHPSWRTTAAFLDWVMFFWNIISVKSWSKGQRKREPSMEPITAEEPWQLERLAVFYRWLCEWEDMDKPDTALSPQTFRAWKQTVLALIDVSKYLIQELKFTQVYLGRFSSDNLERRFSCSRTVLKGHSTFGRFLTMAPQRYVFASLVGLVAEDAYDLGIYPFDPNIVCNNDHDLLRNLAERFYGCFVKNLIKEKKEGKMEQTKAKDKANKRSKIAKLQSQRVVN